MITRPMKASTVEMATMDKIVWPAYCSPKIDGIRLMIHPELGPITSGFKPLPNHHVREALMEICGGSHLDGELYSIDQDGTALFNRTQSDMMSRGGEPNFRFATFDCFFHTDWGFAERYHMTSSIVHEVNHPCLKMLTHTLIGSTEEFLDYIKACMEDGFEGAVVRSLAGPYKSGQSTLNQGWMLKYKPWSDAEGIVIGFEELYHNENPQEEGLTGLSKRSSHKAGKTAAGTLGALVLQTDWGELRVGIFKGKDAAWRQKIWDRNWRGLVISHDGVDAPDLGRKVTFKYQKHGMQSLPRFPVFKGWRED